MNLKSRIVLLVAIVAFASACTRSVTPYEAAHGKRSNGKCLRIK